MPVPADAPAWAAELALGYESGAHGQFILYGNTADLQPRDGGRLVNLAGYLDSILFAPFDVVFLYDLGAGLRIERGADEFYNWPGAQTSKSLPRAPLAAVELVSQFLRYLANLHAVGQGRDTSVACLLSGADQILPGEGGTGHELGALVSLIRDWSAEHPYIGLAFASVLVADNLNDLHPRIAQNPRVARIEVPLPTAAGLAPVLAAWRGADAGPFEAALDTARYAEGLAGLTLAGIEALFKRRRHERRPLGAADLVAVRKQLIEREAAGLIEFIPARKTLDDYHGQEGLKAWLRQDARLWAQDDLNALPMGYLVCGPVGTGKTYLVECLAGEAGVPVVKLKNFRDKWVGSSEGNLEKIFRLIHALGRCIVFIDEADQTLGKRDAGSGDSGLSGRLYSMLAQEMANGQNRGRILWVLASSRPDLIEVDLKRPGRVDVKIPLLPTLTAAESLALLRALGRRYQLALAGDEATALLARMPLKLTPGAAEALAVKAYRLTRTQGLAPGAALTQALDGYQPPVPEAALDFQTRIAVREATDLSFVPEALRHLAREEVA